MNGVLSKIIGREDYKFNPKAIMFDKTGVNYCGLKQVFGLDFVMSKVLCC